MSVGLKTLSLVVTALPEDSDDVDDGGNRVEREEEEEEPTFTFILIKASDNQTQTTSRKTHI